MKNNLGNAIGVAWRIPLRHGNSPARQDRLLMTDGAVKCGVGLERQQATVRYRAGSSPLVPGWEQYPWPVSREALLGGNSAGMIGDPTPVARLVPHAPTSPRLYDKTGSTGGFGAYLVLSRRATSVS